MCCFQSCLTKAGVSGVRQTKVCFFFLLVCLFVLVCIFVCFCFHAAISHYYQYFSALLRILSSSGFLFGLGFYLQFLQGSWHFSEKEVQRACRPSLPSPYSRHKALRRICTNRCTGSRMVEGGRDPEAFQAVLT